LKRDLKPGREWSLVIFVLTLVVAVLLAAGWSLAMRGFASQGDSMGRVSATWPRGLA